ncbi:hypothetical protein CW751_11335 [Brumimicrobium salinarum]|uniref:Uncharacterized protein n=1 Tax=Brumimicrobium salinarum TaxID=2058658 RepID=A0A2I0R0H5_9FLAO|nr:hypothetical protein [Brumimicrobium salinarum]PKR80091.1 hypothetical protein CW751_11335 [Brumimicrobium salinarum]
MMTNIKTIALTVLLSVFSSGITNAQCPSASKVISVDTKNDWGENSQSKSGKLRPGETYEMRFIIQGGIKYRISAAAGVEDFSEDNVDFKVIGKQIEKSQENGRTSYRAKEVVLYDSQSSDDEAIFLSERTRRLTIKVEIKGGEKSNLVQCAAILVEAKKASKFGLN